MVQVDNHDDGKREVTEADYQETSKGKAANSFTVTTNLFPFISSPDSSFKTV